MTDPTREVITDPKFNALFSKEEFVRFGPVAEKRFLATLGSVSLGLENIHNALSSIAIALVAGEATATQIVLNKLSFKNLVEVVGSLAKHKGIDDLDRLLFVLEKAAQAEEIRNQLVHSQWGAPNDDVNAGTRFKTKISRKKGIEYTFEDYSHQDLEDIIDFFRKVHNSVGSIDLIIRKRLSGV